MWQACDHARQTGQRAVKADVSVNISTLILWNKMKSSNHGQEKLSAELNRPCFSLRHYTYSPYAPQPAPPRTRTNTPTTPSHQPPSPILPARESLSTKPLYWPPGCEGSRRCSLFNHLWYRRDSAAGTQPACCGREVRATQRCMKNEHATKYHY